MYNPLPCPGRLTHHERGSTRLAAIIANHDQVGLLQHGTVPDYGRGAVITRIVWPVDFLGQPAGRGELLHLRIEPRRASMDPHGRTAETVQDTLQRAAIGDAVTVARKNDSHAAMVRLFCDSVKE